MTVVTQISVPVRRAENGDLVVLLTPGTAVMYADGVNMTGKVNEIAAAAEMAVMESGSVVAAIARIEQETPSPIFGIARIRTGGGSGLWFHTDKDGNPISLNTSYFDRHPVYGNIRRELVDGQVMNRMPKFYVKHATIDTGELTGCPVTFISPEMITGYHVHPAFLSDGHEIDCFYLGCYKASITDDKLCSLPGVLPAVSRTFTAFHQLAANRNAGSVTGFMMQDVYQRAALQLLMLAEYATPDMQAVLGMGHVSGSAAVTVDNALNHTPWRNFHGVYGNVWEMTDGVRADSNKKLEIFKNDGSHTYLSTNLAMPVFGSGMTGWIVDMLDDVSDGYDLRDAFIPKTLNGTATNGTYADGMWGAVANGVCYFGGNWNHASNAGLFCALLSNPASYSHTSIGCRLAKI